MVSKKDVNDIGIGMLIGAVGLLALPFIFSDNIGGANQRYMVQFFPRGRSFTYGQADQKINSFTGLPSTHPEELNFILSDGTKGVVDFGVMFKALINDPTVSDFLKFKTSDPFTGESRLQGQAMDTALMDHIMNGANIAISKALFDNLKSWADRPYMGL